MKATTMQILFEDAEKLERIRSYIILNLDKELNATILASTFDTTESTLRRHFKIYVGTPLNTFIKESRMQAAMALLLKKVPVKRITMLVGYKRRTTFTHAFTKRFGNPPVFYLRQIEALGEQNQHSFAQNQHLFAQD